MKKQNHNQNKTKAFILAAFFTAVTAACSIISIPLPFSPVPVNLALLAVYLAGGLLGSKYGFLSQLIYLILGAFGVPVFHNLTGGLGIIIGPTGGFIFGYLAAAYLTGFFYHRGWGKSGLMDDLEGGLMDGSGTGLMDNLGGGLMDDLGGGLKDDLGGGLMDDPGTGLKNKNTRSLLVGLTAGLLACYSLGLLWFMYLTGSGLLAALMLCIVPFIPGDILKIIAALALIKKLEPFVKNPY